MNTTRRIRVAAAVAALMGCTLGSSAALADQPLIERVADFDRLTPAGINVAPTRMDAPVNTPGGYWGSTEYCAPEGAEIVGFKYLLGAWHDDFGTDVQVQEERDAEPVRPAFPDAWVPRRTTYLYGPWGEMPPSHCIRVKIVARAKLAHAGAWTTDLQKVLLRDTGAPWVTDMVVPGTWQTGDLMAYGVSQGDNSLARGEVLLALDGAAWAHMGDMDNGRYDGALNLTGLADGVHTLTAARTGDGWETRAAAQTFKVDRHAPGAPSVGVDTDAWTNARSVGFRSGVTADGTGSGWDRNQYQVDDGPWNDGALEQSVTAEGRHLVRARAIDGAGNVSDPSAPRTIRIDRTPPVIGTADVTVDQGKSAYVMVAASDAGSGLDHCVADVTADGPGTNARLYNGPSATLATGVRLAIPVSGRPAGTYTVQVSVCDEAGNATVRATKFTWSPPAPPTPTPGPTPSGGSGTTPARPASSAPPAGGVTSSSPGAPGRDGRDGRDGSSAAPVAAPAAPHAATARAAGRLHWWRPVTVRGTVGSRAVVRGRLMAGRGPAARGTRVRVRDGAGIVIAAGRVGRDGAVIVPLRVTSPGAMSLAVGSRNLRIGVRAR